MDLTMKDLINFVERLSKENLKIFLKIIERQIEFLNLTEEINNLKENKKENILEDDLQEARRQGIMQEEYPENVNQIPL